MCLSSVYEVRGEDERLICEHTAAIDIDGEKITLTDIVGEEVTIVGVLKYLDLARNIIKITVSY
ncbi:MAG: CooT family nickel-binding protein [Oscillospiraceae bacterium]|jgi:predicted RNA-binding protein|nr:CooT family nickel-binding protein [Oscillospiraceae bacterium]